MITVLVGDNDFEITRTVKGRIEGFDGEAERIDGSQVDVGSLADLVMGTSLFTSNRLIVMKNLSESKAAWTAFADFIPKISDDSQLILVETSPDKRTKTFKTLQKHAEITEYKPWGERETAPAEMWMLAEAKRMGLKLDKLAATILVRRAMVTGDKSIFIDQWRLMSALEKLAPLGEVKAGDVERYIEDTPIENVFVLLETALKGDRTRLHEMISRLEMSEDPFKLFGLLAGQIFWLAALSVSGGSTAVTAKDMGAHPFVLGKLAPFAKRFGHEGVKEAVLAVAEADVKMKTSAASPWLLIERALLKFAHAGNEKKR